VSSSCTVVVGLPPTLHQCQALWAAAAHVVAHALRAESLIQPAGRGVPRLARVAAKRTAIDKVALACGGRRCSFC